MPLRKATHKPGSWHQEPLQSTDGRDIAIVANGRVIAVVPHDPDIQTAEGYEDLDGEIDGDRIIWSPEDKANINLLTAAPDLLRELAYLVSCADCADGISDRDWKRAKAAVRKARGRKR